MCNIIVIFYTFDNIAILILLSLSAMYKDNFYQVIMWWWGYCDYMAAW